MTDTQRHTNIIRHRNQSLDTVRFGDILKNDTLAALLVIQPIDAHRR
jgi:hypothetical protein